MPTLANGVYVPPTHLGRSRQGWENVLRRDPCSYCARRPTKKHRTVDHIDPRFGGGVNDTSNLAGACSACNQQKSARSLLHFLLHRLDVTDDEAADFKILDLL